MENKTYEPRPPLGELVAGQPVMVRRSANDMRGRKAAERYIPAVVVKAARVWVDLKSVDTRIDYSGRIQPEYTWRMRKDTQIEGSEYSGSNASFATMEQHAWDETQNWARQVLRENGIRVEMDSRWGGREVELADALSKLFDTSQ